MLPRSRTDRKSASDVMVSVLGFPRSLSRLHGRGQTLRLLLLIAVAALLAGCGGPDGVDEASVETSDSNTTVSLTLPETREGDDVGPPAPTTESDLPPPNESDLVERLVQRDELPDEFAPHLELGDGALGEEVCAGQAHEILWSDQASQNLVHEGSQGRVVFSQVVLQFDEAGEASAFLEGMIDRTEACSPDITTRHELGLGAKAVSLTLPAGAPVAGSGYIFRAADRVGYVFVQGPQHLDIESVLTPEVVDLAVSRLG